MTDPEPRTLRAWIEWAARYARRVVTEPRSELGRWERRVRYAYDLGRYGARKLRQDNASQMAAALSYRTLFSFLPVLVVATMALRAMGGFEAFNERLGAFLRSAGLDHIRVTGEDGADLGGASLSEWILRLVSEAERIDLAAITWVGVVLLVYSAVSLMVTIEESFNAIFRAPGGRPWSRRLPIYWTLLTLGPLAVGATVWADAQLHAVLADRTGWLAVFRFVGPLTGFLGTWVAMFAVFKWMPHTHVGFRPAAFGALVSALLFEGGKEALGAYVGSAMAVRHLYGSLGLVPLFMLWVYVMWLLLLFGTEVAAALHRFAGARIEEESEEALRARPITDPGAVVLVMEVAGRRFVKGQMLTARDAADELGLDERHVAPMLEALADAGFLHRLGEDEATRYTPARPLEQISVVEVLEIGFRLTSESSARERSFLSRLREAQLRHAEGQSLAALVAE